MFTKELNIELSKRPNNGKFKKGQQPWNFKYKGYKYFKHQEIAEKILGRKLTRQDATHHIDLDKKNNKISNLYITTNGKHQQLHRYAYHYLLKRYGINEIKKYIKWFEINYKEIVNNTWRTKYGR